MAGKHILITEIDLYATSKNVARVGMVLGSLIQLTGWFLGDNNILEIGRYIALPSITYSLGTYFAEAEYKQSEKPSELEKKVIG